MKGDAFLTDQPLIRQMLQSDTGKLREIASLSFSRFIAFFAVHSLISGNG